MSRNDVDSNGTKIEENSTSDGYAEMKKVSNDEKETLLQKATMQELQEEMQKVSNDIIHYINNRINNAMFEVSDKFETKIVNNKKQSVDKPNKKNVQRNASRTKVFSERQFIPRNSILTDLFENKHICAIYNVFMVILMILFLESIVNYYTKTKSINNVMRLIQYCFNKLDATFLIWLLMTGTICVAHSAFNLWAQKRFDFPPKSFMIKLWDYGWLLSFILFVIIFITFSTKAVLYADLHPATSLIVLMEQARMLMKLYAFVRSVTPRILTYKPHAENEQLKVPEFSKYLYFFFAPTLIYRDSYPRTNQIRWNRVIWHFTEVLLAIFYISIISTRCLQPMFIAFFTESMDIVQFIRTIFASQIPSMIYFCSSFYCLLHAWMNAWAEMLRFADRWFYMDWWNSKSYSTFYRNWNTVVYDWLHTYIYKDLYETVTKRNGTISTCMVFLISAIYHEFIISFSFRFFYPVMLFCFCGLGLCLLLLGERIGNMFMWFTYFIGVGFMLSLYGIEINARLQCKPHEDKLLDLVIPRSWNCSRESFV